MGDPMKILIVMIQQVRMTSYYPQLGVGYISASLKRAGHDVNVLNPNHSTEWWKPQLIQAINEHNPQMIAVGGMSFHMNQIRGIAAVARAQAPHSVIVIGGNAVSNHPKVAMSAVPEADIGVVGEGEQTIVDLVEALESGNGPNDVKGLIYRENGEKLMQTGPRPMEKNLDSFPWVDWEGIGLDTYAGLHESGNLAPGLIIGSGARVMPLLTSRGCPFACTFCCHELLGRRYRTRSLDDVFSELEFAIDRFGINTLMILDDVFCLKRQRMHEFCERIRPFGLRWECSLRVEQVNADDLKLMHDSGCVCISFGVESMSPPVLKSMKKSTTKEVLARALDLVYEAKIAIWANLILGDPAETMETATESLEWWAENYRFDLRLAFIGFHPGSRIFEDAVERGLIEDPQAFVMSNKPEINGSAMTDIEYTDLKNTIVPHYANSFGLPGRILKLIYNGNGLFSNRSICPHCGKEQLCENIPLNPKKLNQISCIHCNRKQRLPIKFRNSPTEEFKQLCERLQSLQQTHSRGMPVSIIPEAFALCLKICNIDSGNDSIWTFMLRMLDRLNKKKEAVNLLRQAISANPFSPHLFEQMDSRLAKMNLDSERVKYARQASLLRALGITGPLIIDM